jgi:hypothetical protein
MAEPDNMVLILLREIRAEMNERFSRMDGRFDGMDARFETLESKIDSVKQAAFGESVLGRYAVAEVEERLESMERRIRALEEERR